MMFVLGLIAFLFACFLAPYASSKDDNLIVIPMLVFLWGGVSLMLISMLMFLWRVLP